MLLLVPASGRADSFLPDPFGVLGAPGASAMTPHPAVVRVVATERNATSNGSGTLVDIRGEHALVVTNWHVVRDATGEILVQFPDGFRSPARVLKVDQDWDLAALLIWRPNAVPVRIATVAPRPGDVLAIAGYGKGDFRQATGHCTQYVAPGANHPYEMIEVSAQARNGDSGGPIFNQQGELAGVLFGAGGGSTSGSFCGRVRWFLESVWPQVGGGTGAASPQFASHAVGTPPPPEAGAPAQPAPALVTVAPPPSSFDSVEPASQDEFARPRIYARPRAAPEEPFPEEPAFDADTTMPTQPISEQRPVKSTPITQLLGTTPIERAKSVLALLGCLAVVSWVTKSLNQG